LKKAFKRFDIDGDGTIDMAELRRCLTTMGEALTNEQVDEMFDKLDADSDGKVDFDEFCSYMLDQ